MEAPEAKSALIESQSSSSEAQKETKLVNVKVRTSQNILEKFDKQKIVDSLVRETGMAQKFADKIAD